MNKLCLMAFVAAAASYPAVSAAKDTGFRVGEKSRIHTNLDLSVAFDSNPQRRDNAGLFDDWKSRIIPGLFLDVPGSSFSLLFGGKATIEQYFGASTGAPSDTKIGGDITAKLNAGARDSVVGFELADTLSRTPTFFDTLGTVGAAEIRFVQWYNTGKANVVLRPGGGALEFRLGYSNVLSFYDDLPKSQTHGAGFEAKYKFFPRTAVVFNAHMSFFDPEDTFNGGPSDSLSATPYEVTLGLQGQITPRISASLGAGYADTLVWTGDFFSDLSDTNSRSVIGRAQVNYAFSDTISMNAGYKRSLKPIILLDSYVSNEFSLGTKVAIGRFDLGALGKIDLRTYGDGDRDAMTILGDARAIYWILDYLNSGIIYQVIRQSTDATPAPGTAGVFLEEFVRHQVMFVVALRY